MEKKLERLYLSTAKYVHFCRFFIYVFVVFEKDNSGNINPWWGWYGLGHWKGGKACLGSVRSLRTASGLSASGLSHNSHNTHHGPFILPPVCWRAGHRRVIMYRRTCVLFHIHCRSVLFELPRSSFPTLLSRNYSFYVLQILQLQFLDRNSHRICCTSLLQCLILSFLILGVS